MVFVLQSQTLLIFQADTVIVMTFIIIITIINICNRLHLFEGLRNEISIEMKYEMFPKTLIFRERQNTRRRICSWKQE